MVTVMAQAIIEDVLCRISVVVQVETYIKHNTCACHVSIDNSNNDNNGWNDIDFNWVGFGTSLDLVVSRPSA